MTPPDPAVQSNPRAALDAHRYLLVRTFRGDGTAVDVPVWFAFEGDAIVLRTKTATAKVRRIVDDPHVEVRPCDWKGRPRPGVTLRGTAHVLDRAEAVVADRVLRRRYGWQWTIVPMIPVPGVTNGHQDLGLRARVARARANELWPDSSIVRIDLEA